METRSEPLEDWLTSVGQRIKQWPIIGKDPIGVPALVALSLWAIISCLFTISYIIRDYNPLPVWDYWQVAEHLPRYQAFDWSVLWIQHNEHRIVFPELIFAIDTLLFNGLQIFALVVSFACYAGVWAVLAKAFRSDPETSPRVRNSSILLAAIVMAWPGSSVVLGNTFLLQWTMAQFTVALSLLLLVASVRRPTWVYFIGTILAAVVATYSSGNGMVLWVILVAAALLLRLSRARLIILLACGIASIAVYFIGYRSLHELQLVNLVKHPVYTLGFICSYLSMPLGALGQPGIALCCGAFNLIVFLCCFWYASRKKLLTTAPAVVLFGSFFFALGSAVLTAAGRMNVADPKFLAALAARYVSLPLVNWAVLLLVLLWLSSRQKWQVFTSGLIGVLAALCIFELTLVLRPWLKGNGAFIADKQVATVSVENGLHDPDFDGKLYGDPAFVPKMLPVLEKSRVGIYADSPELSWPGKLSNNLFGVCNAQQAGKVVGVFPVLGGMEVTGYTRERLGKEKIVFVDGHGMITGFGEEISAGIPAVISNVQVKGSTPWVGFINSRFSATSFSTYVVDDGKLCPLEGPRTIPVARQVAPANTGNAIPGVSWTATGWKENVLPPLINIPNPMGGSFWSSWNGSDQTTGTISSSPISVPPTHCMVLLVLHGPSINGLHVRVSYPAGAAAPEEIPLRTDETEWKFWRIPLQSQAAQVQITGEDNGKGWGQWLALASPRDCK